MILALLIAAVEAHPSQAAQDSKQLACYERAQSQQARNICAGDAYKLADKALKAQWAQLFDVIKDNRQETKQLDYAQQAWLSYRAAWCDAAAWGNRGETDWTQVHSGCLAELTRQRTKELGDLLLGEGY